MRPFTCALLLALSLSLAASAEIEHSMKLLAPDVGWALQGGRLLWTADNGKNWRDITPHDPSSQEIASVFFLDTSTGWVLFAVRNQSETILGFDLVSTPNAGVSWTITHIPIPRQHNGWFPHGEIFFLDAVHGWMNLQMAINWNVGDLLATTDGGRTWHEVSGFEPSAYGSVRFIDMQDGWVAGGPEDQHLYVTHDGGKSWQEVLPNLYTIPGVSGLYRRMSARYSVPEFETPKRGFLAVDYYGPDKARKPITKLVLFATNDGGYIWQPVGVLDGGEDRGNFPFTVIDSTAVAAKVFDHTPLAIIKLGVGHVTKTVATTIPTAAGPFELSFINTTQGWISLTDETLLSTTDGGSTWMNITPGGTKMNSAESLDKNPTFSASESLVNNILATSSTPAAPASITLKYNSQHVGFDTCDAPSESYEQTWWNDSPYFDTGIYVGNSNAPSNMGCPNQTYLDAPWITNVTNQGWGLLPLWVGPQAPCTCVKGTWPSCTKFWSVYINTDGTAQTQGQNEADTATIQGTTPGVMEDYGLNPGTPIYYDIENYTPSTTCNGAAIGSYVNAFLDGWVSEIHKNGYIAGVYGNPAPASSWYSGGSGYVAVSPTPDDVWIAKQDSRATIWSLGFTDSAWINNQRIHQYRPPHNETWPSGSAYTINIDTDIEDANATGGDGQKYYTFVGPNTFTCLGNWAATGINNATSSAQPGGTVVGVYWDSGISNWEGYLYKLSTGSCTALPAYGGTNYETVPEAINNSGLVVGYGAGGGWKYNSNSGSPQYTAVTCSKLASVMYPFGVNDDSQIVGYYVDALYNSHGFLFPNCTSVDYPSASCNGTVVTGINGQGIIVGYYYDANCNEHAFEYNLATRTFSAPDSLDYPGAFNTRTTSINNNAQIVGVWTDSSGHQSGFFYNPSTAAFTNFDYGFSTGANGINDTGTIAGSYEPTEGSGIAYLAPATP